MRAVTDPVQDQYEAFPYPARDPKDEKRRLVEGSPGHILEINHYLFAGRRDFRRPFRALFAGGGTGDGAIMLARQLADARTPAELVHLDISAAARRIAEARAAERGLGALRFVTAPIERLASLGLGRFDYIDCCGVLHHLADPAAGLRLLADALAPEGGIGLMVYGALGRTGVYPMQALIRMLAPDAPLADRVGLARRLLRRLPATNWLARNPAVADHLAGDDAGLVDLLLHARDRAYLVPELRDLVAGAGLALAGLVEPWRYAPESYLADPALAARFAGLGDWERAAAAELLAGNFKTHIAYVVPKARAGLTVADASAGDAVPVLKGGDGQALARQLRPGGVVTVKSDGLELRFPLPEGAGPVLAGVDGQRSRTAIGAQLAAAEPERWRGNRFDQAFDATFRLFNGLNRLFIGGRPGSVAAAS
jgi:SAM-dependent methyltransferase